MAARNTSTELIFNESTFRNLIKKLDDIERKLKSVQETAKTLKKNSTKVEFKFQGLQNLDTFLDSINKRKVDQFIQIVDGFSRLTLLNSKSAGFKETADGLKNFAKLDLAPFSDAIKKLSQSLTNQEITNLEKLSRAFGNIAKSSVGVTGKALDMTFITSLVAGLDKIRPLGDSTVLDQSLKNLSRFANAFPKIINSLAKTSVGLKSNTAVKLGAFLGQLQIILRGLAALSNLLGGKNDIRAISLAFERLGIGIAGMTRNLGSITLGSTAKLSAFLATISLVINFVGKISGSVEKTKSLASIFSAVASLLNAAFTGFSDKDTKLSKKTLDNLRQRVGLITTVIGSLKGIKLKDGQGIGATITALTSLFKVLGSSDFSLSTDKKTIQFFKEFVSALKDLNKLRFNDNVTKALEGIGRIFENSKNAATLKNAKQFGGNLSNSVALGFIKGTLAIEIGKFVFRLFTDLNPAVLTAKFVTGMVAAFVGLDRQINATLQNIVNRVRTVGSELTNIGQTLINNFGVGALFRSSGFQIAVEFDDLANRAQVVGDLTEEQLARVLDIADEVGIQYPVSANEALQAIINLQKAGIQAVPDIEAVIRPVADLAALSESGSIEASSKTIITAIQSFAELRDGVASTFENSAVAADIFSQAADLSTASVQSLSDGIANVGPLASQFGLSLEETVATLALFEDRGIRGGEAGTQLRSLLTNLTRPIDSVQKKLNELGIELTDNEGNFLSLNDIMNQFNHAFNDTQVVTRRVTNITADQRAQLELATKAYANAQRQIFIYQNGLAAGAIDQEEANEKVAQYTQILGNAQAAIENITGSAGEAQLITQEITRTQEQNFKSLNTIFGTFGQQGASILIAAGDDAIKNFVEQMGRLPTAAERAQALMASFKGSLERLRGAGETLLKTFFLPLIDTIFKPFTDGLVVIIELLMGLNPEILAITSTAVAFGSILTTIVGVLLVVVGSLIQFGGAILGIAASFATISGTIGIVTGFTGAILGLVAGFVGFVAIAVPLAAVLLSVAAGFRALIKIFTGNIGGATDAFNRLRDAIGRSFTVFGNLINTIRNLLDAVFGGAASGPSLNGLGVVFANTFGKIERVVNRVTRVLNSASTSIAQFTRFFRGEELDSSALDRLADNPFIRFLLGRSELIRNASGVKVLFENLKTGFLRLRSGVSDISEGINFLFASFNDPNFIGIAQTKIRLGINKIASVVTSSFAEFFNVDLSDAVKQFDTNNFAKGVEALFQKGFSAARDLLLNNREGIKNVLTQIFGIVFNPFGFIKVIANFFQLEGVSNVITTIQNTLKNLFGGILDTIFNVLSGQDLVTALLNAFGPGIQPIINFVRTLGDLVGGILEIIDSIIKSLFPASNETSQLNLLSMFSGVFTFLENGLRFLFDNVITPILDFVRGINFDKVFEVLRGIGSGIVDFVLALVNLDFSKAGAMASEAISSIQSFIGGLISTAFGPEGLNINSETVTDLINGLVNLIKQGADGIANFLGFSDFSTMAETVVNNIVTSISNFIGDNPAERFAEIGAKIVEAVGAAITLAFTAVGTLLGFDPSEAQKKISEGISSVVAGIGDILLGEEGSGILGSISSIFDNVRIAIEKIINLFTNPQEGGGEKSQIESILEGIYNFLARLTSLALETVGASLSGIADFFERLSKLDPESIQKVIGVIGTLILVLTPILFPGFISAVVALFGTIASFAVAIGGAIIGIAFLKNFADNLGLLVDVLEDLANGNFKQAIDGLIDLISRISVGTVFDILGLFGINEIGGMSKEEVLAAVQEIGQTVSDALKKIADAVAGIAQGAVDLFKDVVGAIRDLIEMPVEQKTALVVFIASLAVSWGLLNAQLIGTQVGLAFTSLTTMATSLQGAGIATLGRLPGILMGLGTSMKVIVTSAIPFLATAGAIAVIAITLISAVSNIEKLFQVFEDIGLLILAVLSLDFDKMAEQLGNVLAGIIDFVGSTLVDAFFAVANLLGVDSVLGQTKDDIKRTLAQIVSGIKIAAFNIGNEIDGFFNRLFNDLNMRLSIMAADIRLVFSDAAARVRTIGGGAENDPFFRTESIFKAALNGTGGVDFQTFFDAFNDPNIDRQAFNDFSIKTIGALMETFNFYLSNPALSGVVLDPVNLSQFLGQADLSGSIDDVIKTALVNQTPETRQAFFDALSQALNLPPGERILSQAQADSIVKSITGEIVSGTISVEEGLNFLQNLPLGGEGQLSPAQRDQAVKEIQAWLAEIDRLTNDAIANGAVSTPEGGVKDVVVRAANDDASTTMTKKAVATVTPAVSVEPDWQADPTEMREGITTFVEDVLGQGAAGGEAGTGGGAVVSPEVEITPIFTGVTSKEDVSRLADDIAALKIGLDEARVKFEEFGTEVSDNVEDLNLMAETTETATDLMLEKLTNVINKFVTLRDTVIYGANTMSTSFLRIASAVGATANSLVINTPIIRSQNDQLQASFTNLANSSVTQLGRIQSSLNTLSSAVGRLISQLNEAIQKASQLNAMGSGGGDDTPVKRAEGGSVWRGVFEVLEKNEPELLYQDGKVYLLSPSGGYVQPVLGNSGMPKLNQGGQTPSSTYNMQEIVINEGQIVVQVNGGASPSIIDGIREAVRDELSNRNASIRDRLRTAGR